MSDTMFDWNRAANIDECPKCHVREHTELLCWQVDAETGEETGEILCIACTPPGRWQPAGADAIRFSVVPQFEAAYAAWLSLPAERGGGTARSAVGGAEALEALAIAGMALAGIALVLLSLSARLPAA